MTTRTHELAQRFEEANKEFIALVERLDEKQWRARCVGEGWTVGTTANHIAWAHAVLADIVQTVGSGEPHPNMTIEVLDQMNAQEAAQNAACTKQDVLAKLRSNGTAAAEAIRGLTDAELENSDLLPDSHPVRVLDGLPERVTARDWIEAVLIPHFQEHGSSMLATVFPALTGELKIRSPVRT